MNKFKYLQLIGTITVFSPIILVVLSVLIFGFGTPTTDEPVEQVVEIKKVNTVPIVQKVEPPVVVKPTPIVVKSPPIIKDTVKTVVGSLDTAK
jgi:hypothetical protein